jgi:hypothetical protein
MTYLLSAKGKNGAVNFLEFSGTAVKEEKRGARSLNPYQKTPDAQAQT